MRTPIRDQYGLNEGLSQLDAASGSLRAQKAAAAALRAELRSGLAGLPVPENEYSVSLPELPAEDEGEAAEMEEDAADFKARKAREAEAARLAEERKKTKVCTCIHTYMVAVHWVLS
jgi:pre-mRNA-splicing factor CDC5/CEF1